MWLPARTAVCALTRKTTRPSSPLHDSVRVPCTRACAIVEAASEGGHQQRKSQIDCRAASTEACVCASPELPGGTPARPRESNGSSWRLVIEGRIGARIVTPSTPSSFAARFKSCNLVIDGRAGANAAAPSSPILLLPSPNSWSVNICRTVGVGVHVRK